MLEIAFIVDPLPSLKVSKDSSIAMMRSATRRGHRLFSLGMQDLFWRDGTIYAACTPINLPLDSQSSQNSQAWYEAGTPTTRSLASFSAVLMRKDPPFNQEYLYCTYLLEAAMSQGARVYNHPRAIRDHNEKLALMRYPGYSPPTLVTSDPQHIQAFIEAEREAILKPLDAMGGASIFRISPSDPNRNVIIETITQYGQRTIMAQRYLPAIRAGDKRVLLVAGEPIPYALARIPQEGETRGNLAAGGTGVAQPLSARDQEIAHAIGPKLWEQGLLLVGLDIIGDYLTEINVTSPTCCVEIEQQTGFSTTDLLLQKLEQMIALL